MFQDVFKLVLRNRKPSLRNAAGTRVDRRVFSSFSSSPKLPRVFLQLDRNKENMFFMSFRQTLRRAKERNLFTFDHQNAHSLLSPSFPSTACAICVFLASFNQSARAFFYIHMFAGGNTF